MRIELINNHQRVAVEQGELVSYQVEGHEFIHQKGSSGWGSSDTEMFPIIGPVNEANFEVNVPKGKAIQDQHGLLRQFDYDLVSHNGHSAVYRKEYVANTPIKNSKYPEKSPVEWLEWPYSFVFEKHFLLTENGLQINFVIDGDIGMPFMLGYHPAFKLHTENPTIRTADKEITLAQVLAVGSRALEVAHCETITIHDKKSLEISTKGFGHFMCWTEVNTMVCVEPISFYPYAVSQQNLHQGFKQLQKKTSFQVNIKPK